MSRDKSIRYYRRAIINGVTQLVGDEERKFNKLHESELKRRVVEILDLEEYEDDFYITNVIEDKLVQLMYKDEKDEKIPNVEVSELRGMIVDIEHGVKVCTGSTYTIPCETLSDNTIDTLYGEDDKAYRFRRVDIDPEKEQDPYIVVNSSEVKVRYYNQGTVLRVFKWDGFIFTVTHKNVNAFGSHSKFGKGEDVLTLYEKAKGPNFDDLFPRDCRYSPICYGFMISAKHLVTATKLMFHKDGYITYLGYADVWNYDSDNMIDVNVGERHLQPADLASLARDNGLKVTTTITSADSNTRCFVMGPNQSLSEQSINQLLQKGFYHNTLNCGEAVILTHKQTIIKKIDTPTGVKSEKKTVIVSYRLMPSDYKRRWDFLAKNNKNPYHNFLYNVLDPYFMQYRKGFKMNKEGKRDQFISALMIKCPFRNFNFAHEDQVTLSSKESNQNLNAVLQSIQSGNKTVLPGIGLRRIGQSLEPHMHNEDRKTAYMRELFGDEEKYEVQQNFFVLNYIANTNPMRQKEVMDLYNNYKSDLDALSRFMYKHSTTEGPIFSGERDKEFNVLIKNTINIVKTYIKMTPNDAQYENVFIKKAKLKIFGYTPHKFIKLVTLMKQK
jgi:hypothetical protein